MSESSVGVCILGSTGSVGKSTLDVLAQNSTRYHCVALTGNSNVKGMFEQCNKFRPRYAVMKAPDAADLLCMQLKKVNSDIQVLSGMDGLIQVATLPEVKTVVAGIVGAAGLLPTMAAAEHGKTILLANKESLVMTGDLLLSKVKLGGAQLLPIDSEHNALFQCMPQNDHGVHLGGVEKIFLTASGGPFRGWTPKQLTRVTPIQAVAHPKWCMGKKISVDSATMMNKGLEVIEACFLFSISSDHIEVVVHPESVIHSMVSYRDGSVIAQMGNPDMRTPIAHALAWPNRIVSGVAPLNLFDVRQLNFEKPDFDAFPCLRLAYEVMQVGGTATSILNAANEVAVDEFLRGNIRFTKIAEIIEYCLDQIAVKPANGLEDVLEADELAHNLAKEQICLN